jgi:hypothetical protein
MNLLSLLPYPVRSIIRAARVVVMECKNKREQEKEWRLKTMVVTFTLNGKSFRQSICKDEFKNVHPIMAYRTACAYLLSGERQ